MKPKDPEAARSFCRKLMAGAQVAPPETGRERDAGIARLAVAAIALAHRRAGLCEECPGVRLANGLHAGSCEACPAALTDRAAATRLRAAGAGG